MESRVSPPHHGTGTGLHEAPLVGRGAELALLSAWATRARTSRAGRVLVEGPAGSGKSSLLRAFGETLNAAAVVTVQGARCSRPGEFVSRLAAALGVRPAEVERDPVAALLGGIGGRQDAGLLVLILEDLHEIDDESVASLVRLLRRVRHARVLILATAREELVRRAWRSCFLEGVEATTHRLRGLDAAAVATVARTVRPGRWPPEALAALTRRTRGHPLHLLIVLRDLPDDVVAGEQVLDADPDLRGDIATAAARLPRRAHAALAALAILDCPADRTVLGALAELDPDQLEVALQALESAGLIDTVGTDERQTVRIHHPLQAEAIRTTLPPAAREAWHRAAATLLGGRGGLVHRLAAATAAGRPDAVLAADLERSAAAEPVEHGEAATQLLQAATVAPTVAEAGRLRLAAALRLLEADDVERLLLLREDVRSATAGAARSTVLGHLAGLDGDPAAIDYLESALADTAAPSELRALAGVRLALEHTARARGDQTVAAARAAAALSSRPTRREQALLYEAYGHAHRDGPRAGLQIVEPRTETAVSGGPALVAGVLHQLAGDIDDAHAWFRESLDRARRQEDRADAHEAHIYLAETLWRRGRWDLAVAQAEVAVSWFADGQRAWHEAAAHAVAALVPAARGDEVEARRHLGALRAAAARYPTQQAAYSEAVAEAVLARSVAPHRALGALGDFPRRAERSALLSAPFAPWRVLHAEALLDAGRVEQARAVLGNWPRSDAPLWFDLTRHRLLARVADAVGDDVGASAALRAGLDLARVEEHAAAQSCPVELAELHLLAGTRLSRRQPLRAAAHLEVARSTFVGLGAKAWVARVDSLRHGERDAPTQQLSPRERQVAALVAEGLTSREVADELVVTPKAVDYHLGNIFRKLAITSRRELRGRRFPARETG